MRVISGKVKGRKLKEPTDYLIRPTTDRIKESIFDIVQFDIEGRLVLDLFAGTGQLGIEALSRGAKSASFVDSATESVKLIRENLKICDFSDKAAVYAFDALRYLENDDNFDLIFIDPPYDTAFADRAVTRIVEFDKLNINGIIILETKADTPTPAVELPYSLIRVYRYGNTQIAKYTRGSI